MRILAVDDEVIMLDRICRCIQEAAPEADIASFSRTSEVLEYVEKEPIDVAFLDIQMRKMDGLELARRIKKIQPKANIIFSTAYTEYLYDAISKLHCSGYILKPVTTEQIVEELNNLRVPVDYKKRDKVYARCFGNFEFFLNGEPVKFTSSKSKELLAYLIDRNGAMCSNGEVSAILWEDDDDHHSYLKKCKRDLKKMLETAGFDNIIVSQWGKIGVNKESFGCDYFEWLAGTAEGINAYRGEYMKQYSWAETTNAMFARNKQ